MTGDVSNIGEQTSIALDDVDQIAAHFRTGNGFAIDLESPGLERKCWYQSGLNVVGGAAAVCIRTPARKAGRSKRRPYEFDFVPREEGEP